MEQYNVNEQGVLVEYIPEDYEEDMYAVVPDGVRVIGRDAFWALSRLRSVTLPDTVVEIEEGAFFECVKLEKINIPESVEVIGDEAFLRCYALADSEGFIIVNNVLYGYVGNNEEVRIPQNVTRISAQAFAGRDTVKRIILPEKISGIGEEAFCRCHNLEAINIPEGLKDIGDDAFYGTKIKR